MNYFDQVFEADRKLPAWCHSLTTSEQLHIQALRMERLGALRQPAYDTYRQALAEAPSVVPAAVKVAAEDVVTLAVEPPLADGQRQQLEASLRAFEPWKKGPFSILGCDIDAEWRSDLKWQRLAPHLGGLSGQKVCDIGCNNGYFMMRMAAANPEFVVGLEPYAKHWFTFHLINRYGGWRHLFFELLGVEHLGAMPRLFDTIFCLGILYHHTDPIHLLRLMRGALAKGGRLLIDCQGIPGDEPLVLVPGGRYAGAQGIWNLPTLAALQNWLKRTGFQRQEVIWSEPLAVSEQRASPWAQIKSLEDFLDPQDPSRTIEGYPAPWRFYVVASP